MPSVPIHFEESPGVMEDPWKAGQMTSYLEDYCRMAAGAAATPSVSKAMAGEAGSLRGDVQEPLTHFGYVVLPNDGQETKFLEVEVTLQPKNQDCPANGDSFFLDVVCEVNPPAQK